MIEYLINELKDLKFIFNRLFPPKNKSSKKIKLNDYQVYPYGINYEKVFRKTFHNFFNKFDINNKSITSSMGSCFAEEVSDILLKLKANYLMREKNIFKFSANWGRVYSSINFKQVISYSLEDNYPIRIKKNTLGYFDALRDYGSGYFDSFDSLKNDIIKHRKISKQILKDTEILIFTIGQNDYIYDKKQNFYWGNTPSDDYLKKYSHELTFGQLSYNENIVNLLDTFRKIKKFNSSIKFLITLSPVPSSATLVDENVVVKSFENKCLLRTCINEILQYKDLDISYFPTFEYLLCYNPKIYMPDNRHIKKKYIKKIFNLFKENINYK